MSFQGKDGEPSILIPTRRGKDIRSWDEAFDGHIRIETYTGVGTDIYVDIFDSALLDAAAAQIVSACFPLTDTGANAATEFLNRIGFRVVVAIR
jgi:hypothetical protein